MDEITPEDAAYSNLLSFCALNDPGFCYPPHIRLIADRLQKVESGQIKRLMIMMPPRHGKSHLCSEYFPAWYLGRNPNHYVISASYGQELADDFGRKVRNIMIDAPFLSAFPDVSLSKDSTSAKRFNTNKKGSYYGVGIGGPVTGRGAHLLIIDDPIKNREEAESEAFKRRIKDWYTSTAYTRLMPNGAIIIINTRWTTDDLSGWLLQNNPDTWDVLKLPAISKEGEPLWPEKYSLEDLNKTRQMLEQNNKNDWSALYMQEPILASGQEFKRQYLQFYDNKAATFSAKGMNVYILYDPANSKNKTSDWTAMIVVGLSPDNNYYILEMIRDRLNPKERIDMLINLHRKWNKTSGSPPRVVCEQYGMMTDAFYLKQAQELQNYRFHIVSVAGRTKKEDRIRNLIPIWENGRLYLPKHSLYENSDGERIDLSHYLVEKELMTFPLSSHDDMIDALARICEPDVKMLFPQVNQDFGLASRSEPVKNDWMEW